ncbi:MAG: FAD-dependent oxidoreductase [Betaproteobacteria bacterium]|nr:FAD-dependent oxidoreductase [Betaproteobacteria bacterium]
MLKLGFAFDDLYHRAGLLRLDGAFLKFLDELDPALSTRLLVARNDPDGLAAAAESELLIALAPQLDDFLAHLFGIENAWQALAARHHHLAPLYSVKRLFVQRRALNRVKPEDLEALDPTQAAQQLRALFGAAGNDDFELAFAQAVTDWQKDEAAHGEKLELAARYAAWAAGTPDGRAKHGTGILFKAPRKLDFMRLVPLRTDTSAGYALHSLHGGHLRRREGFKLTDPGTDLVGALDQANYCIWCHEQGKDSCSKGLREKAPRGNDGAAPAVGYKKTVFGVPLAGCPLEEKISEFHLVKTRGQPLAALAIIAIDNPLAAGTGHRICNDCMKSCIYQKQDPVDIPQAETRSLKDVLELPWGFEIYSLLTRWNPLNIRRPVPKAPTGKRVLVVGLGPAGYSSAHHLMNDGHLVVGIDGLKIEPLDSAISGIDPLGRRTPFRPIRDLAELYESLDERVMAGFGGVAEYGITVRWDKNFLKMIRLLLERRAEFAMFGGVRFGGTLTAQDAFAAPEQGGLGFDHIVLAAGAGRPTLLEIPNGLARGVRAASDFLMALQLTGAARRDSIANLQIRLPVVVIGGGLTAIDTATESLAYYVVQVEKFLVRYERLCAERGEAAVRAVWGAEDRSIADEFIAHARAIRAERARAAAEKREARLIELLQSWGGVTVAYRRRLVDSPSYTLNHEEIEKALEEGIRFAEGITPTRVELDEFGHARAVRFKAGEAEVELPARSLLVAAGTQPNTVLAREDAEHFKLDGKYFAACDSEGNALKPERSSAKPRHPDILMWRNPDGRFVSFFGDLHPSFFGNVVKAMGSAKQGYPVVSRMLERVPPASPLDDAAFLARLNSELRPVVHEVRRLTPTILEVVLRAPRAARRFEPGQFYRLQNFETLATRIDGTTLAMEGLALTGAWVDKDRGLLSTIILEMGGSSDLCAHLKPGEPVILMGPTGTPTEIASGETVLLAGGGLGNAVLFSIGQALRAAGSKVLYFAGYRRAIDRYKIDEIEKAADTVVWCTDEGPAFTPSRAQDRSFVGNIVAAMQAYASGQLGAQAIPFSACERIVAIGSDRMMAAVGRARHEILAPYMHPTHQAIGSINSPMQCMMKEICAQCLQPHVDPNTGERSYVFSCFNQDQPLDEVDFAALNQRLRQNGVHEKLTALWIDRCLKLLKLRAERVA